MSLSLSRRNLLSAVLAAGITVPLGGFPSASAAAARLTLPRPTGPYRVGTVPLHFVDRSTPVPHRELMAGVWYPAAADGRRYPVAPWMPSASWHALLESVGLDAAEAPLTAGHVGAPALRDREKRPIVIYSHGNNTCRAETTIVVQELVSHGYVVATIDHTGDGYTELPDGRVLGPYQDDFNPWHSTYDMRFLLDRLEDLAAGRLSGPAGLGATLDLRRIGMFGWSKGATSTALMMNTDRRVRCGIGFDGEMQSQPPVTDLSRPFMVMSAEFPRDVEPSVEEFWQLLHGWRLNIHAKGAAHGSYNDQQWLVPQIARLIDMTPADYADWCGTLNPARAVRIQQAYPRAFFDLHLRGHRQPLLEGPSRAFPEVRFIP